MVEITENESHHVVIYARTAAGGQHALEEQVTRLKAAAARRGWAVPTVVGECRAWGISSDALAEVQKHDVVVVHHVDRLSRDVSYLHAVWSALESAGLRIATPDHVMDLGGADAWPELLGALFGGPVASGGGRGARTGTAEDGRTRGGHMVPAVRPSAPVAPSAPLDRQVAALQEVLRQNERGQHAERTRRGIAAAKAQKAVRR